MSFQLHQHSILLQNNLPARHKPRSKECASTNRHATTKIEEKPQSFLGILKYLSKFSPATAEVCKTLQKLTSVKAAWTWNRMYQDLYDTAKNIIKKTAWNFMMHKGPYAWKWCIGCWPLRKTISGKGWHELQV